MSAFLIVAGLLTLLAIGLVVVPLLRPRTGLPSRMTWAVAGAVLLAGGAAILYPTWSQWKWSTPVAAADSPAAMVGRLARRLEREPNDLEGWLMLGRSYSVIEQYPLSARAYQRADRLAGGTNVEAITGLAEALVLSDRSGLDGQAGRLFERALELDPTSTKALFYSAIAALERGERPLARTRFEKLLQGNPPPEVRRLIEEQVQMLSLEQSAPPAGAASVAAATPAAAAPSAAPAAATTASVPLRITLAASVAEKAAAGAPLFVMARIPGQRGPPLAAKRLDARFPQELELSAADAVMGGSGFSAGQELEIEARVANGGSAIARNGDPYGTVRVRVGAGGRIAIEINQLKP